MKECDPLYVISVAARLVGMHAQTLRKYERERFVAPSRTKGRLRLYSAADLDRLRQVKHLVEVQGLNLAGVELALLVSRRLQSLRESAQAAQSTAEIRERVERDTRELITLLGGGGDDESPARAEIASGSPANRASLRTSTPRGRSRGAAARPARRSSDLLPATKE